MKPGFLMIVMVPLENGQMSAALVNTESLEDCERRAKAIRTVLTDQEILIKDFVCRSSEPFSHGAESTHAHRAKWPARLPAPAQSSAVTPFGGSALRSGRRHYFLSGRANTVSVPPRLV